MKLKYAKLEDICFEYTKYTSSLYDSIARIGLSFAIKVSINDTGLQCIDGHKRLSVLQDLKAQGIEKKITIITVNDGSSRSNDCWRSKNTH